MRYGDLLRDFVAKTGVSQRELADRLGVTPSSITQYFNAEEPSIGTVVRICKACGTPSWQFLAEIETGAPAKYFEMMMNILEYEPDDRLYLFQQMELSRNYILKKKQIGK